MDTISRRSFLGIDIHQEGPEEEEQVESRAPSTSIQDSSTINPKNKEGINRRTAIQLMTLAGASAFMPRSYVVAIDSVRASPEQQPVAAKSSNNSVLPSITSINPTHEILSHAETTLQEVLMMSAQRIADTVLDQFKIEHGNTSVDIDRILNELEAKPFETILQLGVLSPAIEEALFRYLPSLLVHENDPTDGWSIGIPTSALFAMLHTLEVEEDTKELRFGNSIPLSQFMGGLFFWYLMREKGYSHATLAHSLNNTIPLSIGAILLKKYPPEKAKEIVKKISGENKE